MLITQRFEYKNTKLLENDVRVDLNVVVYLSLTYITKCYDVRVELSVIVHISAVQIALDILFIDVL